MAAVLRCSNQITSAIIWLLHIAIPGLACGNKPGLYEFKSDKPSLTLQLGGLVGLEQESLHG